jgi:hypothetical protein
VRVRKNGIQAEQLQYDHRAVGCQIVSSPVKSFLAFEWLQPNEGEETAAVRALLGALYARCWTWRSRSAGM